MMHLNDADRADFLLDAIYDGAVESPGWSTFLGKALTVFGVETAAILIETHSMGHPEQLRLFPAGTPSWLRDEIDAFASKTIFAGAHSATVTSRRATLPDPDGKPVSFETLSFSAGIEPGIAFAFGLWRRAGEPFAEADAALCATLAPHLKRAMRIFVRYAQAYRERAVYQAVIERIGVGVALVDAKSTVMATNAIAREIVGAHNGLAIAHNRLTAAAPALAKTLGGFVHAAAEAQTTQSNDPGQPLAVPRDGQLSPLTVMVHPGPEVQHINAPLRRSAIVVMRDPDRRASVSAEVVGRLFGLTPAEAQLAALLAQGSDLDEAAAELGIRRNTARSQLQAVFMKTDVKRQSELVRMILSSVATLSH
jgi:DNA-binding CsgD family transcriptional regulator/PAS domain-containing protein